MSKIKTIFLTGVLVFSMAFMSACAGKTEDQQEAAVEETAPAAEILQQGRVIVVQYFLCFLPERECSCIFQEEQL